MLKAKKLGSYVVSSDESVVFWEVSLDMHTLCVERKLLLSLLFIERPLGSEEGSK